MTAGRNLTSSKGVVLFKDKCKATEKQVNEAISKSIMFANSITQEDEPSFLKNQEGGGKAPKWLVDLIRKDRNAVRADPLYNQDPELIMNYHLQRAANHLLLEGETEVKKAVMKLNSMKDYSDNGTFRKTDPYDKRLEKNRSLFLFLDPKNGPGKIRELASSQMVFNRNEDNMKLTVECPEGIDENGSFELCIFLDDNEAVFNLASVFSFINVSRIGVISLSPTPFRQKLAEQLISESGGNTIHKAPGDFIEKYSGSVGDRNKKNRK